MKKNYFYLTESSEKAQSGKNANISLLVELLKNLGLDILGVFTPAASIMSLIKTTVQIIRKKKCTLYDVVTILIGILGLVPTASKIISAFSIAKDLYFLYKFFKSYF